MIVTRTTDPELIARLNKPVQELHAALYPHHFKPYDYEEIRSAFARMVANENHIFLIVHDHDEPVSRFL